MSYGHSGGRAASAFLVTVLAERYWCKRRSDGPLNNIQHIRFHTENLVLGTTQGAVGR